MTNYVKMASSSQTNSNSQSNINPEMFIAQCEEIFSGASHTDDLDKIVDFLHEPHVLDFLNENKNDLSVIAPLIHEATCRVLFSSNPVRFTRSILAIPPLFHRLGWALEKTPATVAHLTSALHNATAARGSGESLLWYAIMLYLEALHIPQETALLHFFDRLLNAPPQAWCIPSTTHLGRTLLTYRWLTPENTIIPDILDKLTTRHDTDSDAEQIAEHVLALLAFKASTASEWNNHLVQELISGWITYLTNCGCINAALFLKSQTLSFHIMQPSKLDDNNPTGNFASVSSVQSSTQTQANQSDTSLDELIDYAAQLVTDKLTDDTTQRVSAMATRFDAARPSSKSALNVFVYHVDMSDDAGQLKYRDVSLNTNRFDYKSVLDAFIASVLRWHPEATIYLATSLHSPLTVFAAERIRVVELDIAPDQPMYERVNAMCAYTQSNAFDANTLFLDSDAFLNARMDDYLLADYDVAITTRDIPGLMPVNEGVTIARADHPDQVRMFFQRYLATYTKLCQDSRIENYYGDIRKWRGGQLTLNAITRGAAPYSPYRSLSLAGVTIKTLPCDPFNYSFEYGQSVSLDTLRSKVVVHLKGGRKASLDIWNKYAQPSDVNRAKEASVPAISNADRRYSLDTTPPQDYEPATAIDYQNASLTEIADHFKTDKGTIKHNYTTIYSRYLNALRGSPLRLLEIGVACGSSLKMWANYFGASSQIVGLDIRPECAQLCKNYQNIEIRIGNAVELSFEETFDIIIDDGSHVSEDIVKTWQNLWPTLKPGGYYIIEDVRCTHDPQYQANFTFPKDPNAFDRRHLLVWLDQLLRNMDFRKSDVEFVHHYRELIILQKRNT